MTAWELTIALAVPVLTGGAAFCGVFYAEKRSSDRLQRELEAREEEARKARAHDSRISVYIDAVKALTRAAGFIPRVSTLPQADVDSAKPIAEFGESLQAVLLVASEKAAGPLLSVSRVIVRCFSHATADRVRLIRVDSFIAAQAAALADTGASPELRQVASEVHGQALRLKVELHRALIQQNLTRMKDLVKYSVEALAELRRDLEAKTDSNHLRPTFDRHVEELNSIIERTFAEMDAAMFGPIVTGEGKMVIPGL